MQHLEGDQNAPDLQHTAAIYSSNTWLISKRIAILENAKELKKQSCDNSRLENIEGHIKVKQAPFPALWNNFDFLFW